MEERKTIMGLCFDINKNDFFSEGWWIPLLQEKSIETNLTGDSKSDDKNPHQRIFS
jgi:hypothetical protein